MQQLLLLYSHCVIVKGASRSTICDLQRNALHLIPGSLAELFAEGRYINVQHTLAGLDHESREILYDYCQYLQGNELAFYCDAAELPHFTPMPQEWLFPAHITHCILDARSELPYFNASLLRQMQLLGCNFIQFRFFSEARWDELDRIMALIGPSQIKSVEIVLPVSKQHDHFFQQADELVRMHGKISNLMITGASSTKTRRTGARGMGYILQTTQVITTQAHCGVISADLFSINISTFTESIAFNSCLNRKISIDVDGNIKNCPSMAQAYGNIREVTLDAAISNPDFKQYWGITKDAITKCKDCEFRHVCTDCRAYLDDPADIFSAPLKCGYDPYSCQWDAWSESPLKEAAIDHYRMQELAGKP